MLMLSRSDVNLDNVKYYFSIAMFVSMLFREFPHALKTNKQKTTIFQEILNDNLTATHSQCPKLGTSKFGLIIIPCSEFRIKRKYTFLMNSIQLIKSNDTIYSVNVAIKS